MKAVTLCIPFLVALSAAQAHAGSCPSHGTAMARTELVFGAREVNGGAWNEFLAREVTPRFPDGLTALDGYGQWKAPSGIISREPSRVLLLWHKRSAAADRKIDAIRDAYKKRFHQLSVMRVDSTDCVAF